MKRDMEEGCGVPPYIFYLILRKDQRAKAPFTPAWLITGASFNFQVKIEVNEVPI